MQVGTTTSTNPLTSPTSTTAAAATAATGAAATVDYNSFLQLLVQEMKNQDPTSPSDPTQYLSQLASFSNVEQAVQTNSKLDTMLTNSSLTLAEGVIGKTVTSGDGSVSGQVVSVALGGRGGDRHTGQRIDPDPQFHREGEQRVVNEADALGLVQSTIWTIVVTSGPAVLAAMVIGIVVALFQALTQIQEMTLTFVPKIIAILLVLSLTASFIGSQMFIFTEQVYARIERGK